MSKLFSRLAGYFSSKTQVGVDKVGNRYFTRKEEIDGILKEKRWVIFKSEEDPTSIPVEWICWLNGQRKKAPTPEEMIELDAKRERTKQNVALLKKKEAEEKKSSIRPISKFSCYSLAWLLEFNLLFTLVCNFISKEFKVDRLWDVLEYASLMPFLFIYKTLEARHFIYQLVSKSSVVIIEVKLELQTLKVSSSSFRMLLLTKIEDPKVQLAQLMIATTKTGPRNQQDLANLSNQEHGNHQHEN